VQGTLFETMLERSIRAGVMGAHARSRLCEEISRAFNSLLHDGSVIGGHGF
jgi:hypothetical protein